MNTARSSLGGAGVDSTSALGFGGSPYPAAGDKCESWNGTNWTEVNDLNTARTGTASMGINTAALAAGGGTPGGKQNKTEQWNGTNWTEVNDLNISVETGAGSGLYTDGLAFGGEKGPGVTANTESWNGTSWASEADLSAVRRQLGSTTGTGTSTSLAFGGETPGISTVTDEWTKPSFIVKTLTD